MKILVVNQFCDLRGGVERHLKDLLERLPGDEVVVDCLFGETPSTEPIVRARHALALPELWIEENAVSPDTTSRLADFLRHTHPDVVYLHNIENPAAINSLASFAPTLRYVHHHKVTCPDGKRTLQHPLACCSYPAAFACMIRGHLRRCMPRSPRKAWCAYRRATGTLSSLRTLPLLLVASEFMKWTLVRNQIREDRVEVLPLFASWPPSAWVAPGNPRGLLYVGRLAPG
jgi:hypothetical protein